MRLFNLFILPVLFAGCAKLGYLTEQGMGQVGLQWRGVKNEKILADPKISPEIKRKIQLVETYKKFFYDYFDKKPTGIYSKTTMLDSKAVTYLVVASPHTRIAAHEFEFPFMGSFPYIGFFSQESAHKFARELEREEKLVTWIRPVYAYSTLGYLEDRILSSFFEYDDIQLAELVFHELFHTVFFIKDEVELNENLANLYGKELVKEFFKDRPELANYLKVKEKRGQIDARIVEMIAILQSEFQKLGSFLTDNKADEITQQFVTEVFRPELKNLCLQLDLDEKHCELKEEWNQASFAAFLTYEEKQNFLEELKKEKNLDLKEFLNWLNKEYQSYDNQKKIKFFSDWIKLKVSYAPSFTDRSLT
jgi:predicted aminopeptidase